MKTQLRAVCPACHGQWALMRCGMSAHGYTRTYGWNNGACAGQNEPHFGTEAGRKFSERVLESLIKWAQQQRDNAVKMEAGEGKVFNRDNKEIENPTEWQRKRAADQMRHNASMAQRDIDMMTKRIANWTPADPVEVEIVERSGPVVHAVGTYWTKKLGHDVKACASSCMNAMKWAQTTTDESKVTCKACLKEIARKAA